VARRSHEDLTARHERCKQLDQLVKTGLKAGRAAMWATAEALYHFDEESAWTVLGYRSRAEWLADPEVAMTERSYQRLVRVWREAVVRREIDPSSLARLDVSKVEIVLPAVERGWSQLAEALADAEALGWRGLRRKYGRPSERSSVTPKESDPAPPGSSPRAQPRPAHGAQSAPPALAHAEARSEEHFQDEMDVPTPLDQWLALYDELRRAVASGDRVPRVNGSVIVPGLDALAHLLEAAGVREVDGLLP
jgi:hypothetical protein